MLGAGMVKFYVPIYMFMMNHSGIVSVIKKKVYPLLTKRVHHETSLGILRSYALTIQRIDNSEISQCMLGRNFAIDV